MLFWCIFERYFFYLICNCMYQGNVVNEFWTQRLTVLLFVTKVLGTCTCTWLKKYLMYLMPSKYCEYLYLYLNLQILKVLVLDSSTSESTWPQPWPDVTNIPITRTSRGYGNNFWKSNFLIHSMDVYPKHFRWNCSHANATEPYVISQHWIRFVLCIGPIIDSASQATHGNAVHRQQGYWFCCD